jgi:hypothetical protein
MTEAVKVSRKQSCRLDYLQLYSEGGTDFGRLMMYVDHSSISADGLGRAYGYYISGNTPQ